MDDDKSDESFKICVEVMQNHNKLDDAEWNATIEQSIAAHGLHPNLFSFFCEIILPRLKHLVSLSPKAKLENIRKFYKHRLLLLKLQKWISKDYL